MNWLILILLSVITLSLANILQRAVLKNTQDNTFGYIIVFQFSFSFVIFLIAIISNSFSLPELSYNLMFYMLLAAMLWAMSTVFRFKAFKLVQASTMSTLSPLGNLVTIFLSIFILHEVLTINSFAGIALIIFAVFIIISLNARKINIQSLRKTGLLYAIIAIITAGTAVVIDALVLKQYNVLSYLALDGLISGILMILYSPKSLKDAFKLIRSRKFPKMAVFILFYILQAILYYYAFKAGGPMAYISTISEASIILTVILGAIFLKEKKFLYQKLLAGLLAVIGILLLNM